MALTLKQRGLITQSYGVQNAGTPGDLLAVDSGSFTRRPYGPSLAGWPLGWSAHTLNADARHTFAIAGASGPDLIGMGGAWYYFGPGTVGLSGEVELINVTNQLGGNEYEGLRLHVSTMSLDLLSLNARFPDALGIKTVRRNWPVWLGLAWEYNGGAANWTMKVLYREAGGSTQVIYTTATYTTGGGPNLMTGFRGGAIAPAGSTSTIYCRYGLPSLYQMASMADAAYPSEITEPTQPPYRWYASSAGSGSGDGTSTTTAWNATQLAAELAANSFTVTSGYVLDSAGATLDTDSFDADTLVARYLAGTALANGDRIYVDDSSGPLRPATTLIFSGCDNFILDRYPTLSIRPEIRGTTRVAAGSWTLDSGSIYKATLTNSLGVIWEFPNTTTADSRSGKGRWLAHPTAANIAAYRIAATPGSFWSDGGGGTGTNIYVQATTGNPTSNGQIYECSTANNLLDVRCKGGVIRNLTMRYSASVGTNNDSGLDTNSGDCVKNQGANGWLVITNNTMFGFGRHAVALTQADATSTKTRHTVFVNNINDGIPTAYCNFGGQTLFVDNAVADGGDNQVYYEDNQGSTNVGVIGQSYGAVDVNQPIFLQHNGGAFGGVADPTVYSKAWFLNNRFLGQISVGAVSATVVVKDNVLGYAGTDNIIGGLGTNNTTILTMTGNWITGRSLPALELSNGTGSTVFGNIFLLSGTCNAQNWRGRIEFDGNTIYDIGLASGASNSLFLESGVLLLNFYGNTVKLGAVDIAVFGNGVHSQENFNWNYNEYDLPPAAVIARNYNDGSTTSDRTFTQWKALFSNQFDQNSADNSTTLVSATTYRPPVGSPAVNAVALLNVISLKGASDVGGNVRGVTGTSEAGGWLYQSGRDKGLHTKVTSFA